MPYITQGQRDALLLGGHPINAGELNYALTLICIQYLKDAGKSYQTMNDIVGALENAKNEFQRRVQHPYEDKKIEINGEVYT